MVVHKPMGNITVVTIIQSMVNNEVNSCVILFKICFPQRRGLYPPPPGESDIIGLEVAGTVDTLGPGVSKGWKPDDRVMALLCGGGYAEYVAVPEELLMPVPPNLTLSQAAAIPETWLTAFQLLVFIGTSNSLFLNL